jgi:hypothetical protein
LSRYGRPDEFFQPVIGARVELDHVEALPQESDEGEEQRAVEAVLVEIGGSDVGRRDNDDASREERGEQPGARARLPGSAGLIPMKRAKPLGLASAL